MSSQVYEIHNKDLQKYCLFLFYHPGNNILMPLFSINCSKSDLIEPRYKTQSCLLFNVKLFLAQNILIHFLQARTSRGTQ